MKPDEVYKELHTILFGGKRRAKAAHIKTNVLRFPGFKKRQGEDEETAKSKVKDKLLKCHRERLLEFCDIFDLPKTTKNKEDIVAKLCEFLDKPHHLQKRKKSEDHSPKPSSKRNKTEQPTKPLIMEPEYLEEKRSLQDLWKAAFPMETHWHELDELYNKFNWDFKNLEVVCEFNWDIDQLECAEVVDSIIENEKLSAEQKDEFKEFVNERVRAAKRANREARAEMRQHTMISFHSIKMYKFYPLPPPDISGILKSRFINRYYENTLHVF